jgi:hypothetical protein
MKAAVPTSTAVFAISPSGQLRTDRAAQIQLFDQAAHFDFTTPQRVEGFVMPASKNLHKSCHSNLAAVSLVEARVRPVAVSFAEKVSVTHIRSK